MTNYQNSDGAGHKHFLVQPYMVKPNGNVFDEVRNWFIDGKWSYAIYTDGTDDNAVYPLKEGGKGAHLIEPTRKIAEATMKEVLKVAKWRGKNFIPPMTRIDIGVIPVGNSETKVSTFVNEIEMEAATWLVRYVPYNIVQHMCEVYPKKFMELIQGLKPGERKPDVAAMEKLAAIVDKTKRDSKPGKRKRSSSDRGTQAKWAKWGA